MGLSKAQLLDELTVNNEFFDFMVDMIPSKLYISPRKLEEEGIVPVNRFFRNSSKQTDSKESRRAAAKVAKRRKLDPAQPTSTTALQERLTTGSTLLPPPSQKASGARIDALRAALQAKIAAKQASRPTQDPSQVSKRAARRAEKERRKEEAKKRKTSSSVTDTPNPKYTTTAVEDSPAADLAQLDFGRLAGLSNSLQKNYEQSNKALSNLSKSKNLHKALQDAESKREKLAALKQGDESDQQKAQKMQWSDTLREADGQRIKDDPAKLKKALKRKAAKKVKSQKAWQSRTAQTASKMQDRQTKRKENLANRGQKKEPAEDAGRRLSRAGFEGRKRDFLNGGSDTKKPKAKNQ